MKSYAAFFVTSIAQVFAFSGALVPEIVVAAQVAQAQTQELRKPDIENLKRGLNSLDSVFVFGMAHSRLGSAVLDTAGGSLRVSNLGNDFDGVRIDTRNQYRSLHLDLRNPDSSGSLPDTAAIQLVTTAVINGVPDQTVGAMRSEKQDSTWSLMVDFSSVGTTEYELQIYHGGIVVLDRLVFDGMPLPQNSHLSADPHWLWLALAAVVYVGDHVDYSSGVTTTNSDGTTSETSSSWSWNGAGSITVHGDPTPVLGDSLVLTSRYLYLQTSALSAVEIHTERIPSLTITAENATLRFDGLDNRGLNNAALNVSGSELHVTNIGSSGNDGVDINLAGVAKGVAVYYDSLTVLPTGASLQTDFYASGPGVPTRKAITGIVSKTGSTKTLKAGFAGVTSVAIEVWRGGGIFYFEPSHIMDSTPVAIASWISGEVSGCDIGCCPFYLSTHWPRGGPYGPDSIFITGHSGSIGTADSMHITPQNPTIDFDTAQRFSLLAKNISSLTIASEEIQKLDCCHGSTGNVDCDAGDGVDIGDLTMLVSQLFIGFETPCCSQECDMVPDNSIDIGDLSFLIDHLFVSFPSLPDCS